MKSNLYIGSLFLLICAFEASIIMNKPVKGLKTPPESKKLQINIGGKNAHTISITEDGKTLVKKDTQVVEDPEEEEYDNIDNPDTSDYNPEDFEEGFDDGGYDMEGGQHPYGPPGNEGSYSGHEGHEGYRDHEGEDHQGGDSQDQYYYEDELNVPVDDRIPPEGHVAQEGEPTGDELTEPEKAELQSDIKNEIDEIRKEHEEFKKALPENFRSFGNEELVSIKIKAKLIHAIEKAFIDEMKFLEQQAKDADEMLVTEGGEGEPDMNDQLDNDDHQEGLEDTESEKAEAKREDEEAEYDGHETEEEEIDAGEHDMADIHKHPSPEEEEYDDYDNFDDGGDYHDMHDSGDDVEVDEDADYYDHDPYDDYENYDEDEEDFYSDGDEVDHDDHDVDYVGSEGSDTEEEDEEGEHDDEWDDEWDAEDYDNYDDEDDEDDEDEDWKKKHKNQHKGQKHHHHHKRRKMRRRFVKAHMVPDHMFKGHFVKSHMVKAHYALMRPGRKMLHHRGTHGRHRFFRRELKQANFEVKPVLTRKISDNKQSERKLNEDRIRQGDPRIGPVATDKRHNIVKTIGVGQKGVRVNLSEKTDLRKDAQIMSEKTELKKGAIIKSEKTDLKKNAQIMSEKTELNKGLMDNVSNRVQLQPEVPKGNTSDRI